MTASSALYATIKKQFAGHCSFDQPLSELSYWKIGGSADCVIQPNSIEMLSAALELTHDYPTVPRLIIGDTSNLLFDDKGFAGVLIKIGNDLSTVEFNGNHVYCEAGAWVPGLAYQCFQHALSGIEHTCGIPGRLGGLVYMNGGSNRRGILENVESVTVLSVNGQKRVIESKDIDHSYRYSPFQGQSDIIVAATLCLEKRERAEIRKEMLAILSSRRKKFPRKLPNCGSVFLSNPSMYDVVGPPGFAIEKAGLKGKKHGNAQISPLHANFIVNLGGAKAIDVLSLIHLARDTVYQQTGFKMDCEARFISAKGTIEQAHIPADALQVADD